MRLAENVVLLALTSNTGNFYPVLTWDKNDIILIDTGLPHFRDQLFERIEAVGFSPLSITKVLITHQDIDHFGNAHYFAQNGAKIYASEMDAPYIEGKKRLEKLVSLEKKEGSRDPMEEAIYQVIKENVDQCSVAVDVLLTGKEILDFCGGIRVINIEGHTPGHIGFFLQESQILIAGDAAELIDGQLVPPDYNFCSIPEMARRSFEKIRNYKSSGTVCYHGGIWRDTV